MAKRSMLDQFAEIKAEHPDTVLFFRMGDFYEMFYEDAEIASEVLGITLTSRDKSADEPVPMAGVPWHSVESYLQGMLRAGHKVTLCEQEEELRPGSKILERVVTRVYTPGSLYEENLIGEDGSSILASLSVKDDVIGMAILDSSTGRSWVQEQSGVGRWERIKDEVQRWSPSELVVSKRDSSLDSVLSLISDLDNVILSVHDASSEQMLESLREHLKISDLGSIDLDSKPLALKACGLAARYIANLHLIDTVPLRELHFDTDDSHLVLDQTTLRNLELSHTLVGEKQGSLLQSIDSTRTWMGRRLLKEWIMRPLTDKKEIGLRHSAVSSLFKAPRRLDSIREALKSMRDLERLSTRLAYGRANARDLVAISECLSRMPKIQSLLSEGNSELLHQSSVNLDILSEINQHISERIVDEPPATIRDGGIFRFGVDNKLKFDCEWAAWSNGTAVRELDFHDTFLAADYSHPGDNIPPLISVAQQNKKSGLDLLRGIITAYEVQVNLVKGICLHKHKVDHIAHLGPSVAAGIGSMLRLNTETIYHAVQQALHTTISTRQSRKGEISSWKAYAPAHAGKLAIEAVDRVMRGEGAPSPIYEGEIV